MRVLESIGMKQDYVKKHHRRVIEVTRRQTPTATETTCSMCLYLFRIARQAVGETREYERAPNYESDLCQEGFTIQLAESYF